VRLAEGDLGSYPSGTLKSQQINLNPPANPDTRFGELTKKVEIHQSIISTSGRQAKIEFMKISRKTFVKGAALGTLSLPLFLRGLMGDGQAQQNSGPNIISGKKYEWKMVTTWPPNFPIIGEACKYFADRVEAMSNGRITIRVYGGGELVPALEAFDAVRSGAAEISSGCAYYWAGKIPAAQFFGAVPFGMNAQQVTAWIMHGGGKELWEELYRDYNAVPMLGGNTGVQMGGWFNKEINSIQDFKGLKMRIPGLGGKVFEKVGGTPVLLAGGEIYTGLERGVIDATEWLGPFHDAIMGFDEIAKYYYTPGWHETGSVLELAVNKKTYDELPADLQAILQAAAVEMNNYCWLGMETKNAEQLATFMEKGVDIRTFPQEVMDELRVQTNIVVNELADSDPFARKVYDSYLDFSKKAAVYANITEQVFYEKLQIM